jgi:hypothetical protein
MVGRSMSYTVAVGCLEELGCYNLVFGFETEQRGGFIQGFTLQLVFFELWCYAWLSL